jgi:zinc-binding alcohol dehydrogenase family protein
MRAVGFTRPLPVDQAESLVDLELAMPVPGAHDVLVEVRAVSVNPVDTKVRRSATPPSAAPRVLGWDAAGVVREVGAKAYRFQPGDRVWYAGELMRQGSNAEFQAVDERLVGSMPKSLDFAAAAALPLTGVTAWELLFDRLEVQRADPCAESRLLVIGAAGGVGSILLQLARALTGLTVVGTASRTETRDWARSMGAHQVIDHGQPWRPQLAALGIEDVTHVVGLNHTGSYAEQILDVLRAEGQLALIDDPGVFDIAPFKRKSLSVHWEYMFTRSMYATTTLARQHDILRRLAALVDAGVLRTTLAERITGINATNLRRAHAEIERGHTLGKIVLEGWS